MLLTISLSFAGLSLNCKKTDTTTTPTPSASEKPTSEQKNDLTNVDPSSFSSEISANLETAKQKAAQWQGDAVLYSASAKITSSLDPEDVIEVYTFGTPAQASYWWTISISTRSKNYVRAIIPKEDYLGSSLVPVRAQFWKISYVEAFQVAEKNGGSDWRGKQTQDYQITATLAHGEPKGYLYWTVEYRNNLGTEKKAVQIDANSGEVINGQ